MILYDVEQRSPEWFALRLGRFTSSILGDLFMKETTKGYQEVINKVVFERATGETPETYSNEYMKRGSELEPFARQAYELETFNKVHLIGFVEHDDWIGGSPDGFIGVDGILEIKVPKWNTLINYILEDSGEGDYKYQIQGNLFISKRQWCDFFVWHPKLPPLLKRINRDEKIIAEIQKKLERAIEQAKERLLRIAA